MLYSIITLMVGNIFAQAIAISISPILTRIYAPEDFGIFSLYVSISSIISVIATGLYESAVMLPEKDEDALNILTATIILAFIISAATLAAIAIFYDSIIKLFEISKDSKWLYMIPPMVLVTGLYQPISYYSNRKKEYKKILVSRLSQSSANAGISLGTGFGGFGTIGMILGNLTGQSVATAILGRLMLKREKQILGQVSKEAIIRNAKKYREFPIYAAPASLLNIISSQAPILFLTTFFGLSIVGYYSLIIRTINLPASLITKSLAQVYHQRIAELRNKNRDLTGFVLKTACWLTLIASVPFLCLVFFAPILFSFVFGESWRIAGEYAQILVFALTIELIISPLSTIMSVSGNLKKGSMWKVIYFFTTLITLYVSSKYEIRTFLIIYTIHQIVLYLFYFYLIIKASKEVKLFI